MDNLISHLEEKGWVCLDTEGLKKRNQKNIDVAFVLLPGCSIPSHDGNSISTLVENLVEKIPLNCLVFSARLAGHELQCCNISDRILYYQNELKPGRFSNTLGYKLLSKIISPHPLFWQNYIRAVVNACKIIKTRYLVIEDVPDFCFFAHRIRRNGTRMILHQHAFSQRHYSTFRWKFVQRDIDKIIFVSRTTAERTEQLHGKMKAKWTVVYNGVDIEHYDKNKWLEVSKKIRARHGIAESAWVLLFVGRLIPSKGVGLALEAFINLNLPDVHFMIAGAMGEASATGSHQFHQELLDLGQRAEGKAHFVGNVSQELLPAYYCASDFVIVPSLGSYEGLPKVITESLAMGVPVIASDCGGSWELLAEGRSGWRIPDPVTIQSIERTILKALNESPPGTQRAKDSVDRQQISEGKMLVDFLEALKTT